MSPGWISEKAHAAFDPDRVEVALESIAATWPADFPELRGVIERFPLGERVIIDLLSWSPISCDKIVRDPAALLWISRPEISTIERGPRRMRSELEQLKGASPFDPAFRALRLVKSREMLRIAAREIAAVSSVEQTTLELTHLAEVCLCEVYREWHGDLSRRWGTPNTSFAVLGMGKFGGRELNYSSDIDVIFLHGENGQMNARFTYQDFFARLCEKIVAAFSDVDAAGPLFRIDLRLRPEGASGPIVRSLESMENYYAGYGETWERMALIKARGVCGSEELAYEFSQRLQPFIYPNTVSPDLLDEIGAIKGRIEREIVGHENLNRNVKLGRGGIREIEFVVQTLQLLHGAKHAFLHERSTLKALQTLQQLGFIPTGDADALASAYRFLRTVEHRLQIECEQQIHTIPERAGDLRRLAASLRFSSVDSFQHELERHTRAVRTIFEKILRSKPVASDKPEDLSFFTEPEQAKKRFLELGEGATTQVPPRARRLFVKLKPVLVDALKEVADPDTTLNRFVSFVERYGIRGLLYEALVVNPKLLELLMRLFDSSGFLTDIVLRRPQWIEEITRSGTLGQAFTVADYLQGLRRNEEQLPWADWMRVYRRGQILRIFFRDVLSISGIEQLHAEYTALAEACLAHAQQMLGFDEQLTIVAMGKFGGCEASYGCDLDVVFIGGEVAQAAAVIKAMTTITSEGIAFPVDARLRPEGDAGLLTTTLDFYEDYFAKRAQPWEAQALTKARPVAGPGQREYLQVAMAAWRRFGSESDLFVQVKAMHERVVRERATDSLLDFKTGVGGLMELEFLVQALQMRHGIWENNTNRAIGKLRGHGVIEKDIADALGGNYLFLRRCEAVIRRDRNSSLSTLPAGESSQRMLARRLGYDSRDLFLSDYRQARSEIHGAFERLLQT